MVLDFLASLFRKSTFELLGVCCFKCIVLPDAGFSSTCSVSLFSRSNSNSLFFCEVYCFRFVQEITDASDARKMFFSDVSIIFSDVTALVIVVVTCSRSIE